MANNKVGLDYFELDCQMEEKVRLIQAEFGLKGFAVVVKLYQKIYGEFGYYCEWSEDSLLLFMSENGVPSDSKNLIQEIVLACVRRNIFSEKLFKKFSILTSYGVQKRYMNATSRREKVSMKKEYLLISDGNINRNVDIIEDNVCRNSDNVSKISQSREEESKEENKNNMCKAEVDTLFECLWKMYPVKKGKGQVSFSKKKKLFEIGFDEMSRAIKRYLTELKKDDWRRPQNGSTFFQSGYIDYLDANYVADNKSVRQNKFNDFIQNDYDYKNLEKELIEN